jgi:hypothetical protein
VNNREQDVTEEPAGSTARQLQQRIAALLDLPETASVETVERESPGNQPLSAETKITVRIGENHSHEFVIAKPLAEITDEDIRQLQTAPRGKPALIGQLFRFFGWWLGFSGLYAMFAVCPFCGQQGCPVGAGSAGVVGGFFALVAQNGRAFLRFINHRLFGTG